MFRKASTASTAMEIVRSLNSLPDALLFQCRTETAVFHSFKLIKYWRWSEVVQDFSHQKWAGIVFDSRNDQLGLVKDGTPWYPYLAADSTPGFSACTCETELNTCCCIAPRGPGPQIPQDFGTTLWDRQGPLVPKSSWVSGTMLVDMRRSLVRGSDSGGLAEQMSDLSRKPIWAAAQKLESHQAELHFYGTGFRIPTSS